MGAPKGNEFWRMRTKIGRDKIFSSPEQLWNACVEYFEYTDSRTWDKVDFKGKDVEQVAIPTSVPYTQSGLFIFLDIDENTWARYRKDAGYEVFWEIVRKVDKIIYTQKFEGASVGAYNASIIARDLGLKEHTDVTTDGEKINTTKLDLSGVSAATLEELANALSGKGGAV